MATTVGSALTADGIKNTVIGLGSLSFGTMISSAGGVAVGAPVAVASGALTVAGAVESAYGATVLLSSARNMGSDMQKLGDAMSSPEDAGSKIKSVDDILDGAAAGRVTKGKTTQYVKPGDFNRASNEFDSLNPSNVKNINTLYGQGKTGTLPDGRTVTVRPGSTDGRPTLEIRNPNGRGVEIRYGE